METRSTFTLMLMIVASPASAWATLGDLNCDNTRNVMDVVKLVNLVLGNESGTDPACSDQSAAELAAGITPGTHGDMQCDGLVNVLDVVALVNVVLGADELAHAHCGSDCEGTLSGSAVLDICGMCGGATGHPSECEGGNAPEGPLPVNLHFFTLIHTGEGGTPVCESQLASLKVCYALAMTDAPMVITLDPDLADSYLAQQCIAEEAAVEACELVLDTEALAKAPGGPGGPTGGGSTSKSCKLENFDLTRTRDHERYDHQLAVRYVQCRDGLIDVLEGMAVVGIKATVQFHGGFLENLVYEDAQGDGTFSFEEHLVGKDHEISFHHHFECELSTTDDNESTCVDVENLGNDTNTFGSAWGDAKTNDDDKLAPSTQALADTRLDSLLAVVAHAETVDGGYFNTHDVTLNSTCGWGTTYRLKEDLATVAGTPVDVEIQPQFQKLISNGVSLVTSGSEFTIDVEEGCFNGSNADGNDPLKALIHPIQLSDNLWFYPSPAIDFGEPGNDDPQHPLSDRQAAFNDVLSCIEVRVENSGTSTPGVVPYDGQTFVWSGTAHLHNHIQGDPAPLPEQYGVPGLYPAGVVEIAKLKLMIEASVATHNADSDNAASISVSYGTLTEAHEGRNVDADHRFPVILDSE